MVVSGTEPSTLPPNALAARSTTTEPGCIVARAVVETSHRWSSAGYLRGGDDDVELGDRRVQCVLLRGALFLGQLAGVTSVTGRRHGCAEVEETRSGGGDIGAGCIAHVVAGHDRAEPTGGADRLQPGDAGTDHQNPCRTHRSGRGHEHRQVAAVGVGREYRCLVAGDVGLRTEHVHRLSPAQRAGQTVQADRGHLGLGQTAHQWRIDQRREQPDENLTRPQHAHVRRSRRAYADDDVGLLVQPVPGDELGTGIGVFGIGEPRRGARAGLDDHLLPGGPQPDHAVRTERDPPLAGRRLGHRAHHECAHIVNFHRGICHSSAPLLATVGVLLPSRDFAGAARLTGSAMTSSPTDTSYPQPGLCR